MVQPAIVLSLLVPMMGYASARPIMLPASPATLRDLKLATTGPSYTGSGYASGFDNKRGEIEWTFPAEAGIYDLFIRYRCNGAKGYELVLNDVGNDGMLPSSPDTFTTAAVAKVQLVDGKNVLSIGRGWGHYEIDSVELRPSQPFPPPKTIEPKLVDPHAIPAARALMARLASHYGHGTFTGVITNSDRAHVLQVSGMTTAIMGGDLIDYSPSRIAHGSDPKHETERLIAAARAGHIITLCWHWNAPTDLIDKPHYVNDKGEQVEAAWYFGFYSRATTFNYADAIDHPDSANYALMMNDIDTIAVELKKLDAAGIPVLWRPLHESDGKWFWWGTRGSDHFKRLWRLLFDRLINHHQLHNLIWVYTWNDPAWYPGDDVVDIVGMDAYPERRNDPLTGKWADVLAHFDGKKLIALSEVGGTPDLVRMYNLGVRWSYFASWTGPQGPREDSPQQLSASYQSPKAFNLANP